MVDAMYVTVREDGRVQSKALMIAIGVNEEGHREELGFDLWDTETDIGWKLFFESLATRGLRQIQYVLSDSHKGLVNALHQVFLGATWQRCQVNFMRNIMEVCPAKLTPQLKEDLRERWASKDQPAAREPLRCILETYSERAPKSMRTLEEGFDNATAVLNLPSQYRRRLRTTNALERLNQELRRRERVIRIFPNRESVIRLLGALLCEHSDRWMSGRKWFDMAEYVQQDISQEQSEVRKSA